MVGGGALANAPRRRWPRRPLGGSERHWHLVRLGDGRWCLTAAPRSCVPAVARVSIPEHGSRSRRGHSGVCRGDFWPRGLWASRSTACSLRCWHCWMMLCSAIDVALSPRGMRERGYCTAPAVIQTWQREGSSARTSSRPERELYFRAEGRHLSISVWIMIISQRTGLVASKQGLSWWRPVEVSSNASPSPTAVQGITRERNQGGPWEKTSSATQQGIPTRGPGKPNPQRLRKDI